MVKPADRRDLSQIRESGSTARVLNLASVAERFGETPEYSEKPFFRNRRLNRAVILKHTVRADERSLFLRPVSTTTKVVLPFATTDLRLGGASFFVGQQDFAKLIKESIGGYDSPGDFETDFELLNIIDTLPSFDPFLMRERLRRSGIEPSRCYFEVSDADVGRMRAFVTSEIAKLVELAFKDEALSSRDMSSRLADKLMTDETAQSLAPLRATLRLTGDEYREGVFAWKGFLYYKWMVGEFAPRLADLARSILATRIMRTTAEEREQLSRNRSRIVSYLGVTSARVQGALHDYDKAFEALSQGQPTAFRDFLLKAPAMFLVIGEAVGVIKHIDSFWRFRFPQSATPLLDADEAYEIFQEFEATLGGVEAVRSAETAAG